MGENTHRGEGAALFLHRLRKVQTISSDIALRLAEMPLIRPIRKIGVISRQRAFYGEPKRTLAMINRGGANVAFRDFQPLGFRLNRIKRQSESRQVEPNRMWV